ncbi:MAG: hypothetical protein NTW21_22515 [Verrucomicrobia bacterium]|nr:hypothetical protein [Verrucomicrobiota bacterium]
MKSSYNIDALHLLGFDEHESSPQKIAEQVAVSGGDPDSLLKLLPRRLVIAGPALIAENYKVDFSMIYPAPLKAEVIDGARRICLEHFGKILASEEFKQARITAAGANQAAEVKDSKSFPGVPASEIGSIQSFPLLAGAQPPYIPLLRVDILSSTDTRLMSETLTWGDVLFCVMSMLSAVAQHADGTAELLKDNQLRLHPDLNLGNILRDIKLTASRIEQRVLGKEGDETAQEVNIPATR